MTPKLERADLKILHELDENSRVSLSQMGKKLHLHKNTVQYRVNRLEKLNIIQSYYTICNYAAIGYTYTRFYFNFHGISPEIYQQIVDFFLELPNLAWLGSSQGLWRFAAVFLIEHNTQALELQDKILGTWGQYILKNEVSPACKLYVFKQRYAYLNDDDDVLIIESNNKHSSLDGVDKKLIELLSENARMPMLTLAERMGLTAKSVTNRLRALQKKDVLLAFRYQLNHKLLGYDYYHIYFVFRKGSADEKKQIINEFRAIKNTFYIVESVGCYNLEVELLARSWNEMHHILDKIFAACPGVIENYDVDTIHDVYKAF